MNIAAYMVKCADETPDAVAVMAGEKTLHTYRSLTERAAGLAAVIRSNGVEPGDCVMLVMSNAPEFIEIFWAALWCGGIVAPINAKLHDAEIAGLINKARPKIVFCDGTTASAVKTAANVVRGERPLLVDITGDPPPIPAIYSLDRPVERDGDDIAWLFFTSGTTGSPKGALLTHKNLSLMAASFLHEVCAVERDDILLHAAPMSHGSGMYMIAFMKAGSVQLVPESGKFLEGEIVDLCGKLNNLCMFAAPTMVRRLLSACASPAAHAKVLHGLKLIVYGGGPMLLEMAKQADKLLPGRLAQIYGQAECPMTITRLSQEDFAQKDRANWERRLSSVGRPFASVDVRIDSPDDRGAGEILVKSELVMKGYLDDASATRETIEDGWLRTGDGGYFDNDGCLHLSDRIKDMIISGGTNIYPREVEDILIQHESIYEVAVVGRPSELWGEDVTAFISLNPGCEFDEKSLEAFCLKRLSRFKRPKAYFCINELPKNAYGKIDKKVLVRSFESS